MAYIPAVVQLWIAIIVLWVPVRSQETLSEDSQTTTQGAINAAQEAGDYSLATPRIFNPFGSEFDGQSTTQYPLDGEQEPLNPDQEHPSDYPEGEDTTFSGWTSLTVAWTGAYATVTSNGTFDYCV
ncbi:Hypothetical predicted protein [Cloeon dipterum]|uniref:Uncharacterized protein n=1 Tax=Cloeon dipterum TaxID=197152 RepID=A0A8S1C407_9INSE|nr:Hypothetical predicted protein [Cloeon dipterum]